MAALATLPVIYGLLAAAKVSGWRFSLWAAGLQVAGLGIASLGISAVSQLSTPWAVLAILSGVVFIAVGELQARRNAPPREPDRNLAATERPTPHRTDA